MMSGIVYELAKLEPEHQPEQLERRGGTDLALLHNKGPSLGDGGQVPKGRSGRNQIQ